MLEVAVYRAAALRQIRFGDEGAVRLGRRDCNDPRTVCIDDEGLADLHAVVEPVAGSADRWRLTCRGPSLWLADGRRLATGQSVEFSESLVATLGETIVELVPCAPPHDPPFASLSAGGEVGDLSAFLGKAPSAATLQAWFSALGAIHRTAVGSGAFFEAASRAVCDPGGLDLGLVLLRDGDSWRVAAARYVHPELGVAFRRDLVDRVADSGVGRFHSSHDLRTHATPEGFRAVAAAPILDSVGETIGVVYGARTSHRRNQRRGIRPLEAQWLQLVAGAVAAGMLRQAAEAAAARRRVLLEQAFSPRVAAELEHNPQLFAATERELSLLFMDVRGFSSLAERLPPDVTFRLLSDLFDRLTRAVMDRDGVVIDYAGDGLAAMWNAPEDQPDHVLAACRAAEAMLAELPRINHDWRHVLDEPLRIGIGLHVGAAQVGNAGTSRRLKYGPRGAAVNLAARVESATKQFNVPWLVTRAVVDRLPPEAVWRRVGRTDLRGVREPVDLFEILALGEEPSGRLVALKTAYEQALECYETGALLKAHDLVEELRDELQAAGISVDHLARQTEEELRHGRREGRSTQEQG